MGVAWHYGDPLGEQREAERGVVAVDRSNRTVITITGAERLTWLHSLLSQDLANLPDAGSTQSLNLDVQGHVLDHFWVTDLGGVTYLDAEPGSGLAAYLQRMVFWAKVEVRARPDLAMLTVLGPRAAATATTEPDGAGPFGPGVYRAGADRVDLIVDRAELTGVWGRLTAAGARPAGSWAYEALRAAAARPRAGVDTDDRAIPHEMNWIGSAVHLDKGCYRGQETVSRVQNLGRPPRRLVLLHLDGSADSRPSTGDPVTADGRSIGRVGTVVDHYELGPIALALIKRAVPDTAVLRAGETDAAIDADVTPAAADRVAVGRDAVNRLRGR